MEKGRPEIMDKRHQRKITRRDFIKEVGKGAAAISVASVASPLVNTAKAAERDYILIGRPDPKTGPISAFGETSPWSDDLALEAINKAGGIYIKEYDKKLPLKIKFVDTQSNPTKAAEVASRLILHDKVDLMMGFHTPATVNPVTSICERYKVPCISVDNPIEMWLTGGPYNWSFLAFFTVMDDLFPVYLGMWEQLETNRIVGLLCPNDVDGIAVAETSQKLFPPRNYKIIDPGRFPLGNPDYSSVINVYKKEKVDILFGNMVPPDFAAAWRQCSQMGFRPKIATIGRCLLFPSAIEAIGGDLPMGLSCEIWWSPHHPFKSSLTGQSAKELCEKWTQDTGKQWTQPLGFVHAAYEIAANALNRAQTLDKESIRQAIASTNMDTIVGPIKFNEKNYARTPMVGGQWTKGEKYPWDLRICYNGLAKSIPTQGKLFAIPS
jgi:branched-chain amino acid transport system substrate-binding protein